MTLVCLAFLISLHSCLSPLSFQSPSHLLSSPPVSFLSSSAFASLFLLSLSLSGCPLADKSLRSLMAAHTPELKYVCSAPSLSFHCHLLQCTATGTDTVQHHNASFCWSELVLCCCLLPVLLLHQSWCIFFLNLAWTMLAFTSTDSCKCELNI